RTSVAQQYAESWRRRRRPCSSATGASAGPAACKQPQRPLSTQSTPIVFHVSNLSASSWVASPGRLSTVACAVLQVSCPVQPDQRRNATAGFAETAEHIDRASQLSFCALCDLCGCFPARSRPAKAAA